MTRKVISTLAYAAFCLPFAAFVTGCDEGGGLSPEVRLKIDDAVECEMLEKQVPGSSVSVVRNGRVLYQKGYGKADIEGDADV
ncbi:MAG TPA: hypothetical protein VHC46_06150, partial [Thermodesulfobacteriota bacterium]|nr:hypothetical protein [Thermodesulfobacteriota bacterium]